MSRTKRRRNETQRHPVRSSVLIEWSDGFHGDANEVVKQAIESTEGFTFVLSGLEALLEHGIELNLVADKWPDDCVKR